MLGEEQRILLWRSILLWRIFFFTSLHVNWRYLKLGCSETKGTYSDSISFLYTSSAIFLITVPLLVRGSGLSFEVIRIISLKIRLNAAAALLARSTTGLKYDMDAKD